MEAKKGEIKGAMITAKTSLRKKIMMLLSLLAWKQVHSVMILVNVFSISKTVGKNSLTRNLCAITEGEIWYWRYSLSPEIRVSRTHR